METLIIILLASIVYILWKMYHQQENKNNVEVNKNYDTTQIIWNDIPGCFERHLQRRHNNPIFPKDRQEVTQEDLSTARNIDDELHKGFIIKYTLLLQMNEARKNINDTLSLAKDTDELIKFAYTISGNLEKELIVLEQLENELEEALSEHIPESLVEEMNILKKVSRIPFISQSTMDQTPILENEFSESLLCEDVHTIKFLGSTSREFEDYHPNIDDIKIVATRAIERGADATLIKKLVEIFEE